MHVDEDNGAWKIDPIRLLSSPRFGSTQMFLLFESQQSSCLAQRLIRRLRGELLRGCLARNRSHRQLTGKEEQEFIVFFAESRLHNLIFSIVPLWFRLDLLSRE
ncbi:hypothetical protein NL676_008925 [Syzygium grande]|nr:hypothetical protein NL676_008925 [Syzygium grande]